MSAINDSSRVTRSSRFRTASFTLLLAAAVLFLASVLVQQRASVQGWEVFTGAFSGDGPGIDPQEQFAATARLFAVANALKTLGILAMAAGVLTLPRAAHRRRAVVAGSVAAVLVAVSFGIHAMLAAGQGSTGVQSLVMDPALPQRMLFLFCLVGLVAAAIWWRGTCRPAVIGCLFLLGSTVLGEFVANFFLAPLLAGHPWTDSFGWTGILAMASTAAAGISMLFAAGTVRRAAGRAG